MNLQVCITKGKAIVKAEGLRCGAPRKNDPEQRCNKMLCKKAANGQIAGNFLCPRCSQEVEVQLLPPVTVQATRKV